MKLTDPGTQLQLTEDMPLDERVMATANLTFDDGVGDSSDDWYILFRDKQTNRLEGMAYIITYGGVDAAEAEKVVHTVRYEEFETIDGVVIPTKFSIYDWNAEEGIHGDALGQVEFSHVQFVEPGDDAFDKPEDASLAPLPVAQE
jgi:hypothetical protein